MTPRPNAFQRLIHRFLMMESISRWLARTLHRLDGNLLRVSRDRYTFPELVGLPIARLTMKGAKTGVLRTLPLVAIPDNHKFVLVATNFGQKHNPAWYYNLKAHPECGVTYKGRAQKFIAREALGDEYQKYWEMALTYYAGYEKYRERSAPRHIPVMVLEPKR